MVFEKAVPVSRLGDGGAVPVSVERLDKQPARSALRLVCAIRGACEVLFVNGDTPETAKRSLQAEAPEQFYRATCFGVLQTPILVTNGTMLEYMLVRSADRAIVDQSLGRLRWMF